MQKTGKKLAAALAAVQLYLQEEADAANAQAAMLAAAAASRVPPKEPGQWAQSGRVEQMTGRRMIQLRAFSNAR